MPIPYTCMTLTDLSDECSLGRGSGGVSSGGGEVEGVLRHTEDQPAVLRDVEVTRDDGRVLQHLLLQFLQRILQHTRPTHVQD